MFLKALPILFCVLISILVLAEDKVPINQLDQAIASFKKEVDDNPAGQFQFMMPQGMEDLDQNFRDMLNNVMHKNKNVRGDDGNGGSHQ